MLSLRNAENVWKTLERAPDRVVAAVAAQPGGFRKELPNLSYESNMKGWGPEIVKRRPEFTMEMVDRFLTRMYRSVNDFVYSVTRDFVRSCRTPVLAPKSEVSLFPWKEPKDRVPVAVRQVRSFLRAHQPAAHASQAQIRATA